MNNNNHILELMFYLFGWFIETMLIHFGLGVAWIPAIILAVTVGSLVLWGLQHVPDILD